MTAPDPDTFSAHWEHFAHEADMGIRGHGSTLEEAFEQTALAMTGVITRPEGVEPQESVEVNCECEDRELLLVDWLNAIIYEMAVRKMLFSRFQVSIDGSRLSGTLWGEPADVDRHQPAVEVKGATFTCLSVVCDDQGRWLAQCVVDV